MQFLLQLLAFSLPLERIGSFELSGMTVRPSQILYLILLLAFGWAIISGRRRAIYASRLYIPLILFFLIAPLSLANSPDADHSLAIAAFTLFTASQAWIIPHYIRDEKTLKTLLSFLFASTLIVGLFGIFQFIGDMTGLPLYVTGLHEKYSKDILGFPRVQSTAAEPLYFANFLLIPLFLILPFIRDCRYTSKSILYSRPVLLGIFGIGILNFILTASRGAYIAFAVGLAIYFVYLSRKSAALIIWLAASLIIIVLALNLFSNNQTQTAMDRFINHVTTLFEGSSFEERKTTINAALAFFTEHPYIGYGLGSFGILFNEASSTESKNGLAIVNNEPAELLVETGMLGFIMIMFFFYALFRRAVNILYKQNNNIFLKNILLGASLALISILIQYQTFSTLYIMHVWFLIALIISIQNILTQTSLSNNSSILDASSSVESISKNKFGINFIRSFLRKRP